MILFCSNKIYNTANVKLSNPRLNKLKSAIKIEPKSL